MKEMTSVPVSPPDTPLFRRREGRVLWKYKALWTLHKVTGYPTEAMDSRVCLC